MRNISNIHFYWFIVYTSEDIEMNQRDVELYDILEDQLDEEDEVEDVSPVSSAF